MSIYVYNTASGALVSWSNTTLSVAQAQAAGQVASSAALINNGLTAVGGLPPLDSTHQWSTATQTVVTVTAPVAAAPMPTYFFLMRFTPTEYAAISASADTQVIQFWDAIRRTNIVDLSDTTIQAQGAYMSSLGLISGARGTVILTTPYVPTSATS
jgi:hypothetical protein